MRFLYTFWPSVGTPLHVVYKESSVIYFVDKNGLIIITFFSMRASLVESVTYSDDHSGLRTCVCAYVLVYICR